MNKESMHLLFKFHKNQEVDGIVVDTMEEHIDVSENKGTFIWGHFSKNKNNKGLWKERVDTIENQLYSGVKSYVFFIDTTNKLLYAGDYVDSFNRADISTNSPEVELIPKYYHSRVGIENVDKYDLVSYCYVQVTNLVELDYDTYVDNIYSEANGIEINRQRGMASKYYVNIDYSLDIYIRNLQLKKNIHYQTLVDYSKFEEIDYISEVETAVIDENKSFIDDMPRQVKEPVYVGEKKYYKRDAVISKRALSYSKYKCEYDSSHDTFISRNTGLQFVEAHHLIPMQFQREYQYSIDVESNIVSLCPNCHRLIHHGENELVKEIVSKLFTIRKDRLENSGVGISKAKLIRYYLK